MTWTLEWILTWWGVLCSRIESKSNTTISFEPGSLVLITCTTSSYQSSTSWKGTKTTLDRGRALSGAKGPKPCQALLYHLKLSACLRNCSASWTGAWDRYEQSKICDKRRKQRAMVMMLNTDGHRHAYLQPISYSQHSAQWIHAAGKKSKIPAL